MIGRTISHYAAAALDHHNISTIHEVCMWKRNVTAPLGNHF